MLSPHCCFALKEGCSLTGVSAGTLQGNLISAMEIWFSAGGVCSEALLLPVAC